MTLKANADLLETRQDEIGARVNKIDKLLLVARGDERIALLAERDLLLREYREGWR